jgi:hypothetical protein
MDVYTSAQHSITSISNRSCTQVAGIGDSVFVYTSGRCFCSHLFRAMATISASADWSWDYPYSPNPSTSDSTTKHHWPTFYVLTFFSGD